MQFQLINSFIFSEITLKVIFVRKSQQMAKRIDDLKIIENKRINKIYLFLNFRGTKNFLNLNPVSLFR